MNVDEYLKERVDNQISWYGSKSSVNKTYYLWFNGLIIVFAALIPVCSGFMEEAPCLNYVIATLGVLTAVFTGLASLLKFQEKWTTYRMTSEALRREKVLFTTATSPYDSKPTSFHVFVSNVERIMSTENAGWTQIINTKEDYSSSPDMSNDQ